MKPLTATEMDDLKRMDADVHTTGHTIDPHRLVELSRKFWDSTKFMSLIEFGEAYFQRYDNRRHNT
jgi:hypothetical protein